MPGECSTVGWDLGGAHLKLALFAPDGGLLQVEQLATPLWQGLGVLQQAMEGLVERLPLAQCDHYLTMTGELVDLFEDRPQGVTELVTLVAAVLPRGRLSLYAGARGFVAPGKARDQVHDIASANWYATATWLAQQLPAGILVDVGSTTTDLLVFADARVQNRGYSDRERLGSEELVYSGVVRTPVMAVVQQVPFGGEWMRISNELFATMADVYRVLDRLPAHADLHPTCDGRDKSSTASMRRLARMLGADLGDADPQQWRALAGFIADRQLDTLALACQRQASRSSASTKPLVGAGSGRFLVERLAQRLGRDYVDIEELLGVPVCGDTPAAVCAPAVAVARLAMREFAACA